MKQRLALAFVLGVLGATSAGCDDEGPDPVRDAGDGGGGDADASDSGGDAPMMEVAPDAMDPMVTLGVPGGRLVSADGRLVLEIPKGALGYPIEISIKAETPAPPGAVGTVYEIAPVGLRLLRAARVIVRYADGEIPATSVEESRLGVYRTGQWVELPRSRPDTSVREVSGEINQLGTVGLLPGLCKVCSTTCDAATCRFGADPQTGTGGVAGRCNSYGNGCQRCVPLCDADGDGYCPGNPGNEQMGGDCNDADPTIHPEAVEVCGNQVDDDCDDYKDDGCTKCTSHADCNIGNLVCLDGVCAVCDSGCAEGTCTFGAEGATVPGRCHALGTGGCKACVPACDADGDGYCPAENPGNGQMGGDCADDNPAISPKATEVCGNGADDDCNGFVDDGCATCSADDSCADGQSCRKGTCVGCRVECTMGADCRIGAGQASDPMGKCVVSGKGCTRCVPNCDVDGDGYCTQTTDQGPGGDCDDRNRDIFPNSIEVCGNDKDDDCDLQFDEGCDPCDSDDDCKQGSQACQEGFCEPCPAACDAPNCWFGRMMEEGMPPVPGVQGRCQPFGQGCSRCVPACDLDGDGVCPEAAPGNAQPGGDCKDDDPTVAPNRAEVCGNQKDDDCDGLVDEACAACATATTCSANETCSNTK